MLLRLHQIEYLQDGQLPSDLSGALLFSNTELDKLKRRVHVGFRPALVSLLSTEIVVAAAFIPVQTLKLLIFMNCGCLQVIIGLGHDLCCC